MTIWHKPLDDIDLGNGEYGGTMIDHLGIEITEIGDDWIKAKMPVDRRTVTPHGRLHGGASVALAETVGSIAANMATPGSEHLAVGLDINANHVRPVKNGDVYATAKAESLGRTVQVWTIRVSDSEQRLVCIARLTMAIIPIAKS